MNQARVQINFFHFTLEHAWKVHAVLPHKSFDKQTVLYSVLWASTMDTLFAYKIKFSSFFFVQSS
jgi:hypothetical protein